MRILLFLLMLFFAERPGNWEILRIDHSLGPGTATLELNTATTWGKEFTNSTGIGPTSPPPPPRRWEARLGWRIGRPPDVRRWTPRLPAQRPAKSCRKAEFGSRHPRCRRLRLPASGSRSNDAEIRFCRARHGSEIHAFIERDETSPALGCEGEQIKIGDLPGTEDAGRIEPGGIAQRGEIGPEFVVSG